MFVDCGVYRDGVRVERPVTVEGITEACGEGAFAWVGLHDPTPEEIAAVGAECGLHELLLEDMGRPHQRAKWDSFEEASLFVFKTARYHQPDEVEIGELQVVVGDGLVITVRHGTASALGPVRSRLERSPDLLALGPLAVLYGIADQVVDDYAPVIEELETDVEEAEEAVFDDVRSNQAPRVYRLKRQVLELRRNIVPVADLLDDLCQPDAGIVPPGLADYFRDVTDHAHRVMGRVEVARELLTDALNANLAQQGVHQNEDMRRISAWAAVIAAPTLLAGVWGMNFTHMPELDWWVGYPVALVLMAGSSASLAAYFRRAGWL